jgi:hypothetical protein
VRSLILFVVVAVLHFVLSVACYVLILPAAFAYQNGFWTAPVKISFVWITSWLLAPTSWLGWRTVSGYPEIAIFSVAFGAAAVALLHAWRYWRRRQSQSG